MSTVRLPARPRRWPVYVILALILLAVIFTVMSQVYVDFLWFREVKLTSVFWTTIRTKVLLGFAFGAIFFVLLLVNLLIVRRSSPSARVMTPEQEMIERVRQGVEPYLRWLLPLAAGVLALFVGIAVSHQWQTYLLWRNSGGVTFGRTEPIFGRDPSFYVFTLPWLRFLQGWLFSALVGITFLTGIGYLLWGSIRPQAQGGLAQKVDARVRAHLSVLLGLIMLVKAWGYYIGRFDLLTSPRGVVEGASYTDVHAQLPALNLLAIVAVICAILFFVNIRFGNWALPVISVLLLALVSILIGTAYPAFVQNFSVKPQEFQREEKYIGYNIEGTRAAFGLDQISTSQRKVDPAVSQADLQHNDVTLSNIRVWRPSVLAENFRSLQRIKQYYDFKDVDVDRYDLNGEERVLMVSGREVTQAGIPAGGGTWQNRHLVYTHGFGAVAAQVNTASAEGAPQFTLQDIPPAGIPATAQPRIYYGEGIQGDAPFVIVKSGTPELDYEGAPPYTYTGSGGIPMGNIFTRALFAWRFRDINLLISSQIKPDSRIMINRDIAQRVPKPAPFLGFDADPYLAVTPQGLDWIWDAYTSTTEYPYSQVLNLSSATDNVLNGSVNYMRNSVKVVTDAYTGAMTYYADDSDPIIQVWMKAFPGLFTPISQAPADISTHFRYPENLFQVQATQFANYHVKDTSLFYRKADFWQIPTDPTVPGDSPAQALRPYYVLMKVPGDDTEHFQLVLPFVPQGRQNMVAWMAANGDGDNYGKIVAFEFPTGVNIDGPQQVFQRINQDPGFSATRTLLGQGGSNVLFGDFLVIPIENSFLYVQPVYVQAQQAAGTATVPELKKVVVANGDTVGVGDDLQSALADSLASEPGGGGGHHGGTGTIDQRVANLLNLALQHFGAADAALKTGDLATYQSELTQAQALVQQANDLAAKQASGGGGGPGGGSPTPPPTATPSP